MARKTTLRAYQEVLAARLNRAANTPVSEVRVGVAAGDERWLIRLTDAGEVVPVPEQSPVPFARPWFRGVASLRGTLYGIVDFSAFLGRGETEALADSRVVLTSPSLPVNCGFLVERMLGLRNIEQLERDQQAQEARPWVAARYRDKDGNPWNELDVRALVRDPAFLEVGA